MPAGPVTRGRWISRPILVAVLAVLAGCAANEAPFALRVESALRELGGSAELWPGFRPAEMPLVLYDGQGTWLFRFPDVPEGYRALTGRDAVHYREGRHAALLEGIVREEGVAGTLTVDTTRGTPARWAVEAFGEVFRAHIASEHPGWQPDPSDALRWPVLDTRVLTASRREEMALKRALNASADSARGWATRALSARLSRDGLLAPDLAEYAWQMELVQGTGRHLRGQVAGEPGSAPLTRVPVPAEAFAQRSAEVGQAWCLLLDRFSGGWKERLEEEGQPLHALAAEALRGAPGTAVALPDTLVRMMKRRAAEEVEGLRRVRSEKLERYTTLRGWRILVEAAPGEPLWPRSYDPDRILPAGEGKLLHFSGIILANDQGTVTVNDDTCLTLGDTGRPLLGGIHTLLLRGLTAEPVIRRTADSVYVDFASGRIALRNAHAGVESGGVNVVLLGNR